MNKKRVNDWLLPAKGALKDANIVKAGKIDKTYRGHISSFGAAVVMGSLPAAVAFFSDKGGSSVERQNLIKAMYFIISDDMTEDQKRDLDAAKELDYVCKNNNNELKEKFVDASIALKLAMNFYDLGKRDSCEKS